MKDDDVKTKQSCFTSIEARFDADLEAGAKVVVVALSELDKEQKKLLRVIVPLGLSVRHGIRAAIDRDRLASAPYLTCFSGGCVADYEFDTEMVGKLKKGRQLIVQAVNVANDQLFNLSLPLQGLAAANERPSTDRRVSEATRKMLEETLTPRGLSGAVETAEVSSSRTYTPWSKYCPKGTGADRTKFCFIGADARLASGEVAYSAVIMDSSDEAKNFLRVTMPLGTALRYGTRIVIDRGEPVAAPYVACYSDGCIADYKIDAEMIARFKNSEHLFLQAVVPATGKPISLPLLLTGFAAAYGGPPTDPKVLEALRLDDQLIRCDGAVGAAACAVKRFHDKPRQ